MHTGIASVKGGLRVDIEVILTGVGNKVINSDDAVFSLGNVNALADFIVAWCDEGRIEMLDL